MKFSPDEKFSEKLKISLRLSSKISWLFFTPVILQGLQWDGMEQYCQYGMYRHFLILLETILPLLV